MRSSSSFASTVSAPSVTDSCRACRSRRPCSVVGTRALWGVHICMRRSAVIFCLPLHYFCIDVWRRLWFVDVRCTHRPKLEELYCRRCSMTPGGLINLAKALPLRILLCPWQHYETKSNFTLAFTLAEVTALASELSAVEIVSFEFKNTCKKAWKFDLDSEAVRQQFVDACPSLQLEVVVADYATGAMTIGRGFPRLLGVWTQRESPAVMRLQVNEPSELFEDPTSGEPIPAGERSGLKNECDQSGLLQTAGCAGGTDGEREVCGMGFGWIWAQAQGRAGRAGDWEMLREQDSDMSTSFVWLHCAL